MIITVDNADVNSDERDRRGDGDTHSVPIVNADRRRGAFRAGERVQLTDVKGRKYTISLTREGYFQSTRGSFRHTQLIGKPEGTVIETEDGHRLLALRPLVADFVLSMPRGAAVIYPKDAAYVVTMADIFPGARVLEAGLGSGALTLSLLAAIGEDGELISVERRAEFAEIAQGNVSSWYGHMPHQWHIRVGDADAALYECTPHELDAVVFDMLAPWENVHAAAYALRPGGVLAVYVATIPQMSRVVEAIRDSQQFTQAQTSETLVRTWHVDGLAIRPDHRMVGHTGFIILARRLAPESSPLIPTKRPAPGAYSEAPSWDDPRFEGTLQERTISPKKLRKVRRDVAHRADVEASGSAVRGVNDARMEAQLDAEAQARMKAHAQAHMEANKAAANNAAANATVKKAENNGA